MTLPVSDADLRDPVWRRGFVDGRRGHDMDRSSAEASEAYVRGLLEGDRHDLGPKWRCRCDLCREVDP